MVPLYHWEAAQRDLQTNHPEDAVAQFRRLLQLDPAYATGTWGALRAVQTPETIFQEMFADNADPKLAISYVDFLSAAGEGEAAYKVWNQVAASTASFPFSSVQPYLERLIDRGRIQEAMGVWQDLQRLKIVNTPEAHDKEDLVFNGEFEQFPLNSGFDWRWGRLTYLAVDFAAPGAHHGAHCLRIDFTVSLNNEYEPVYQIVPVLPSHTYRLQAYVRSEDITSDTGPSLRVSDTQQPSFRDALSETTVGTTPWHPVSLYFATGEKTQAVRLSIWRPKGRVFPTEISGTFWLDVVSLQCVDCDAAIGNSKAESRGPVPHEVVNSMSFARE